MACSCFVFLERLGLFLSQQELTSRSSHRFSNVPAIPTCHSWAQGRGKGGRRHSGACGMVAAGERCSWPRPVLSFVKRLLAVGGLCWPCWVIRGCFKLAESAMLLPFRRVTVSFLRGVCFKNRLLKSSRTRRKANTASEAQWNALRNPARSAFALGQPWRCVSMFLGFGQLPLFGSAASDSRHPFRDLRCSFESA